jgi:DNA-binding response OmpR family regulator
MLSRIFGRQRTGPVQDQNPVSPVGGRGDILLVDDDAHLRELLRVTLEHKGYTVREGQDGADAVRLAREKLTDLVVLDGNMPVVDGFDALKQLRTTRATAKIPVIMLTMRSHQVDMLTGYRYGAQEYLTKPIAVEQLLVSVKRLLGGR